MTTKTAEEATSLWICSQPFASAVGTALRDMTVRSDDPLYLASPSSFQPLGTPDSERHGPAKAFFDAQEKAARDAEAAAEAAFQAAAKANPVRLQAEPLQIYRAASDLACHLDGRPALVEKNSTVLAGHSLLASHSDAWVPVSRR